MRPPRPIPTAGALAAALLTLPAPPLSAEPVAVPFSADAWTIEAEEHRIETFDGRETLWLRNGVAQLDAVRFLNGVLEFDLMVTPDQSFSGARWRSREGNNYEEFYIRPHQSGNPDANQYEPVCNGVAAWQIYFGPQYSAPVTYRFGEWMHLRIEVLNDRAQVWIDGDEPCLVVDLLLDAVAGPIGISSGFAPARFADFRYERTDDIRIATSGEAADRPPLPDGLVRQWSVSDAIDESSLEGVVRLDPGVPGGLGWHRLPVEANGIANLARIQSNRNGPNTTLVRLVLDARDPVAQRLDFGFSDRVRVFVNGALLYGGADGWRSRDYRFLGTVGLFDTVWCPLKEGRNEVILAVSESFGGWAVMGSLVPEPGVRILEE